MKNRRYPLLLFIIILILSIASFSACKKEPSADNIDTVGNESITLTPDLPDNEQEDEDVSDNMSDNVPDNISDNSSNNVSDDVLNDASDDITDNVSNDAPDDASDNVSDNAPDNASNNAPDNASNNTSGNSSSNTPSNSSSNTPGNSSNNTSGNSSSNAPGNASSNAPGNSSNNTSGNSSSNTPGNSSSNTPGNSSNNVSDNTPDNTSVDNILEKETPDLDIIKDKTDETPSVIHDTTLSLKDVFSDYFLMGAAINGYSIQTAAINHEGMRNILKTHFNSTTLSNLMKPSYLLDHKASKSSPDGMPACTFASIDPSMKFCQENGIKMRGHTLIWHTQTPDWFFYEDYDTSKKLVDAATMELRIESYIKQVLEYCQETYPGVIYCWDVVNEALNHDGTWRSTDSLYYQIMRETYIEKAFYYARKYAAEGVSLFYNEYNVFYPSKRQAMFNMLSLLKEKGLVDGIGLQPTVGLNYPELDSDNSASSFKKTLEIFGQLDLEIQITELGFLIDGENAVTPENIQKQADRYYEMMYLLVKMDSDNGGPCNITSVTTFGICDDYPLYNNHKQNIYLWDKQANPKPAFYSYLQAGLDFQAANR